MAGLLDSDPGSELFNSYEADFKLVQADINQKLDQIPELVGEPRKAAIRAADRAVQEGDEILGSMRIEVQNVPTAPRQKLQLRIRNYAHDLDKAKQALRKASAESERAALFGQRGNQSASDAVLDQRQQLLSGTDSLERGSQRLANSQRIALETESVGAGILSSLSGQREQLLNTRDTLLEGEGYVNKSVNTLRGMARRMATNRIITIAIITVLVLLIILVIVSKFR